MFANHQAFHSPPPTHRLHTLALGGLLASSVVSPAWCTEAVSTAAELDALRNRNGTYKLTADINLSDYTPWVPIGSRSHPFTGRLDGNGHSISGLHATTTTVDTPAGLFGYLKDGRIHNLFLDQPYILSTSDGSPAGAIAGKMVHSNVTHVINHRGSVETRGAQFQDGDYSPGGGLVGLAQGGSQVRNNLNTGLVRTIGRVAHAGGGVGFAHSNSPVSGNLNTGPVSTNGEWARAGGAVGEASDYSHVSGNLNTGPVSTNGEWAHAGGGVGFAHSNSPVSGNLNTGPVSANGDDAYAGGAVGYARISSSVRGNLNTGSVSTNGEWAHAGGAVGFAHSNSSVSGNLNTGRVSTIHQLADAGGAVGQASRNSPVSGNLNTGPVSTTGNSANAGGAVGKAARPSLNSGNLNSGSVTSLNGEANIFGLTQLTRNGLQGLSGNLWNAGNNKYPMLKGINPAYQDLRRINGTRYGNNTFPTELNMFARPGNDTLDSLFDQTVWKVRDGYLPFLKSVTLERAEAANIDCTPGGFDCFPASCQFTSQSSGSIEHLLYDGQCYYSVVKADNGLSYWAVYKKDGRRVLPEPCGVYDLTGPDSSGIVVDAAVNQDNRVYVAYHDPVLPGQTPPVDSMLAMLTLSEEGPSQLAAARVMATDDDRITGLSVDGNDVLVNTEKVIYRLSKANELIMVELDVNPEEVIQSVAGNRRDLYLLTHEQDAGYRIRVVPESGADASFMVTTPSGVTTSKQVIASLKISGDWLHLLMIDNRSIIWRKYRLKTLASAPDEAKESDTYAALPQNITPAAITLIPDMVVDTGAGQDQVFIMGNNTGGLPQYFRLMPTDFTPFISNWPWWGSALLGTGTSLTVIALLATTGCLLKKAWDFRHKHDKLHIQKRTRTLFRNKPLPPIPPFFDPGGDSSAMQMTPAATGFVQKLGVEPQAYEEPHIYDIVGPATGVTQVHSITIGQAETEFPGNTLDHREACEPWPGPIKIHQLPEQAPDDLDGFELTVVPEEPWYASTHPGNIASAPVYTELNKPSAKRALQCLEAQPSQQPGADPLGCVGPGQSPTYFLALVNLEGSDPFSRFGRIHLKVLGKGFDLVFRGMEAVDSYVYDFPPGHPKRTRVHKRRVAEVLYGEHLTTAERFDRRIGDMENPVISFCNAMGGNIWHAFLVFRNSKTGEYNTLHIRQGSYYPEFMDRTATERYFYYEQKKIVGAISLARLTELYGARLDLNLLRDIFKQRLGTKEACYRINNQNCMTFSMLAFWATDFDWATFLREMKLANLQSPYHILKALAGSSRNHPAIHSQENNLLPDWLAELNQNEE